jgi:hypothetical protein
MIPYQIEDKYKYTTLAIYDIPFLLIFIFFIVELIFIVEKYIKKTNNLSDN